MHKIITFLGIGPRQAEYAYHGQTYQGRVFAEALYRFVGDFDHMLVFVTESARANTFPVLEELSDDRIRPIGIPNGETPEEMWQTFDAVISEIDEKDTVTFDITHGLRSLPFLVFLAAAFLKSAKQVTIQAIYYGALDLGKDATGKARPAPVIELTEFVTLLDWLNASHQMVSLGDASALVKQLRASRPHHTVQQKDQEALQQSMQIGKAAAALEDVSRALRLILPDQVMAKSETLQGTLGAAAAATHRWARPFTVLARQVADAYAPLALPSPRAPINHIASLNRERQMVRWYLDRNLLVQAVGLAREWLVAWFLLQAGYTDTYDEDTREDVERVLGAALKQQENQKSKSFNDYTFPSGRALHGIVSLEEALNLYRNLGNVRNILLHAGKRRESREAKSLEQSVRAHCERLNELPLPGSPEFAS